MKTDSIIEYIERNLSEKRLRHTYGVRDTAVMLAEIYGEDKEKAETAALFHDMLKGRDSETLNAYVREFGLPGDFAPIADFGLLIKAVFHAEQENLPYHVGNVLTSDLFYEPEKKKHDGLQFADMGVLAVEMETAALYANAALAKARALSILTVSDSMVTGEKTTAEERETSFADMIHVALEIV